MAGSVATCDVLYSLDVGLEVEDPYFIQALLLVSGLRVPKESILEQLPAVTLRQSLLDGAGQAGQGFLIGERSTDVTSGCLQCFTLKLPPLAARPQNIWPSYTAVDTSCQQSQTSTFVVRLVCLMLAECVLPYKQPKVGSAPGRGSGSRTVCITVYLILNPTGL